MHFLCIHPIFCFHIVLSKLSSLPSTLDRHFTIYLQREQFLSCHLPTNNMKKHMGGNLGFIPTEPKMCLHSDDPTHCTINPPVCSIFQKWKPTCASLLLHPSFQKQRTPRCCPHVLPECSPSSASSKSNFSKTQCSFSSNTLTTHKVRTKIRSY